MKTIFAILLILAVLLCACERNQRKYTAITIRYKNGGVEFISHNKYYRYWTLTVENSKNSYMADTTTKSFLYVEDGDTIEYLHR
jgi:hypothetical protein